MLFGKTLTKIQILQGTTKRTSFRCMQGVSESANFPVDQLPMLDVIQTITEPILTKLRFHFATGRPTDRIDQPNWLFQTAANLTKEHYEDFKLLQPAVEAHALGQTFYLPWEFANAMRAAVQTLLREHVLPRLTQQVSTSGTCMPNSRLCIIRVYHVEIL